MINPYIFYPVLRWH